MSSPLIAIPVIILAVLLGVIALAAVVFLLTKVFGLVWVILSNVFRFIGSEVRDVVKLVGAILVIPLFSLFVLLNVVIGRWSASAHFGRSVGAEFNSIGASVYRLVVGNPARLLGLGTALQGVEERLPAAMAEAPGRDKPRGGKAGRFEGYTIIGSLPVGGSGARLYIAQPEVMKRAALERQGIVDVDRVVIKAFSQSDGSTLQQIMREGQSLGPAKELGLVLEYQREDDRFYYVMRYVPGDSLGVVTHRLHAASPSDGLDPKNLRLAMSYAADLVDALHTYHRGGLWHKDIKPDNIIIDRADDRAHLVDFGLVTPMRSAMTLTTHGTEYFRDPELVRQALRGVKVNEIDGAKFDVYSAGAVMFSVIENSFPAHGGLSQITKKCPDALKWIVRRAMADYQRRYTSAAEMRADLEVVLNASNPFTLKPADLPSMGGSEAQAPATPSSNPKRWQAGFNQAKISEWEVWSKDFSARAKEQIEGVENLKGARAEGLEDYCCNLWKEAPGGSMNERRLMKLLREMAAQEQGVDPIPEPMPDHPRPGPARAAEAFAGGAAASVGPMGAAAADGPKRAPKLRVSDWWSGKYTPERGAASIARSPLTDTPFEHAAEKARAGWGMAAAKMRETAKSHRENAKAERRGSPVARAVVPAEHRAPASDQLKNARDRVRATRAKARQRVAGRAASARQVRRVNSPGGTRGLVFGLFLALAVFFAMTAVVGALLTDLTRSNVQINNPGSSVSAWAADGTVVTMGDSDGAWVIASADEGDLLDRMPVLTERVLVLSDLTSPLDSEVRTSVERAFGLLAESGARMNGDLVTSVDDADSDLLDLLARVRTDRGALPLDSAELGDRLRQTLRDIHAEYDGVLWVSPVKGKPQSVRYYLVGPDGVVSSQADDPDAVVQLADEIDDLD